MSMIAQGKSGFNLGRVLVLDDPPAWPAGQRGPGSGCGGGEGEKEDLIERGHVSRRLSTSQHANHPNMQIIRPGILWMVWVDDLPCERLEARWMLVNNVCLVLERTLFI